MKTIELIKKHLNTRNEIKFWTINTEKNNRHEIYLIFNEDENLRVVNSTNHYVSIYIQNVNNAEKTTGNVSFCFSDYESESEIIKIINDAVLSAALIENEYHDFPNEEFNYSPAAEIDPLIASDPMKAVDKVREDINQCLDEHPDVKLSSLELFISKNESSYFDKNNNSYSYCDGNIFLEFNLLAGLNQESESFCIRNEKLINNLNLRAVFSEHAAYAKENLTAQLPVSGKYNVVLGGEALDSFFDFFLTHSSADAFYNEYSAIKIDENIFPESSGDTLTIISNPHLKGGTAFQLSDDYGVPMKKFTVIKENILKSIAADFRYSQYLKIDFTGNISNIEVLPGSMDFDSMIRSENTFYLTKFSTFTPNEISGAFSGEIRSGYFFKNGKTLPVKGGSVSGTMKTAFKEIYFSKEIIQQGKYKGPKGILIKNTDIAGN